MRGRVCIIALTVLTALGCGPKLNPEQPVSPCGDVSSDPNNCGSCGHICTATGQANAVCAGGSCAQQLALALYQANPSGIVVDATNAYWVNASRSDDNDDYSIPGSVVSVPLGGGSPDTIAANQNQAWSIAINSTNIYWTDLGYPTDDGAGMITPLSGGVYTIDLSTGTMSSVAPELTDPGPLAISSSTAYWISTLDGNVYSAPLTGGTPSTFANSQTGYLAIATDANNVYWIDGNGLVKEPQAGGAIVTLSTEIDGTVGLAVDDRNVYWTTEIANSSGMILQMPLDGGTTITIATDLEDPVAVTSDGTNIYWVTQGDGTVQRAPIGGGKVVTLASQQDEPVAITVDNTSVYWVTLEDGTVMKQTPK